MAQGSGIEWTDATWNPATGCDKVSPGCKNCYAEKMSLRLKAMDKPKYADGFAYREHEADVGMPSKWKKPRMVFVNSMSDLFHEEATPGFVAKCFYTMLTVPRHTYQILTKRPEKMARFSLAVTEVLGGTMPCNIWLGTSVEDRMRTDRIEKLRKVDAAVRFISFEPLLGDVGDVDLGGIHWAIIGGESGFDYRPVEAEWVRSLIKQSEEQNVPVFFKQWGGIRPKQGGREIDGRILDGFPKTEPVTEALKMPEKEFIDGITSRLEGAW